MTIIHHEAQQIINTNEQDELFLNEEALAQILLQEKLKDKPVCVVSIAGIYRGGKSFLLNFLLRYLKIRYKDKLNVNDRNWLQAKHGPLKGFLWRHGTQRHTRGILMWPEVFLAELPTGEEVAIVLLDTQGSFDNKTTMSDNAVIFALSTLISSIQIYNLKENIKNYDLDHLQYFSGYGQLAKEILQNDGSNSGAPFQDLMFLIRDWGCDYEYKYGTSGGKKYVEDYLRIKKNEAEELQERKQNVKDLFENIEGFLMPHPGRFVATTEYFAGELIDIEEEFKKYAQEFAVKLLSANNLKPKMINGHRIKTQDLYNYICNYWTSFQSGKLPELQSLYDISVSVQHMSAMESALQVYDEEMKKIIGSDVLEDEDLNEIHRHCKSLALYSFTSTVKMGTERIHNEYKDQLVAKIDKNFHQTHKLINDVKIKNEGFVTSVCRKFSNAYESSKKIIAAVGGVVGGGVVGAIAVASPVIESVAVGVMCAGAGAVVGYIALPIAVGWLAKKIYKSAKKWKQRYDEGKREMGADYSLQ